MGQESIISSAQNNYYDNEGAYFSIGELLIKTFLVFQPQYEDKKIRLIVELDSNCPSFWLGDVYAVQNILNAFLSTSLSLTNSGSSVLKICFEKGLLNIEIDAPKNHEAYFSAALKINPIVNESALKESLLTRWQLKNIEFSDLILELINTLPMRMNQIEHFIQEGLYGELKAAIHALKGVAVGFQLCELYIPLTEMELALKTDKKINAAFTVAYNALKELYDHLLNESSIRFPE